MGLEGCLMLIAGVGRARHSLADNLKGCCYAERGVVNMDGVRHVVMVFFD